MTGKLPLRDLRALNLLYSVILEAARVALTVGLAVSANSAVISLLYAAFKQVLLEILTLLLAMIDGYHFATLLAFGCRAPPLHRIVGRPLIQLIGQFDFLSNVYVFLFYFFIFLIFKFLSLIVAAGSLGLQRDRLLLFLFGGLRHDQLIAFLNNFGSWINLFHFIMLRKRDGLHSLSLIEFGEFLDPILNKVFSRAYRFKFLILVRVSLRVRLLPGRATPPLDRLEATWATAG